MSAARYSTPLTQKTILGGKRDSKGTNTLLTVTISSLSSATLVPTCAALSLKREFKPKAVQTPDGMTRERLTGTILRTVCTRYKVVRASSASVNQTDTRDVNVRRTSRASETQVVEATDNQQHTAYASCKPSVDLLRHKPWRVGAAGTTRDTSLPC